MFSQWNRVHAEAGLVGRCYTAEKATFMASVYSWTTGHSTTLFCCWYCTVIPVPGNLLTVLYCTFPQSMVTQYQESWVCLQVLYCASITNSRTECCAVPCFHSPGYLWSELPPNIFPGAVDTSSIRQVFHNLLNSEQNGSMASEFCFFMSKYFVGICGFWISNSPRTDIQHSKPK